MKAVYSIATVVSLLLTSLQSPAQEARPPAPPGPVGAPAPIANTGTGGPLSCAYCDLRGGDQAGKNLTNANLVGSNLQGAKLAGATLDGAMLIGANLAGADLSGAHLSATSNGPADLSNANLARADFRQAVLTGAHLLFAGLEGADFSGADLTGAVLGLRPKTGTLEGRRTSFRGARMDRRFAPDAETADLDGVIWNQPKAEAAEPGPAGVTCGNSDISGVTNPIYVSTDGTDGASCGASPESACKTLAHTLSHCTPNSCNVLAMYGEFPLPATLAFNTTTTQIGARLYGGCVTSGQADAALSSEIVAPPGGAPAVSVAGINPPVLENFKILGSAAGAGRGAPAVTVQVTSQITLNNSLVVGGQGGAGAPGADQPPGVQGGAANQQTGGTNASCSNTDGGAGSTRMLVQWESITAPTRIWCLRQRDQKPGCPPPYQGPWDLGPCVGLSGLHGNTSGKDNGGSCGRPITDAQCSSSGRGNDGGAGSVGVNATCGSGGTASSNTEGSFVGANWSPGAGGTGTTGLNAGGGGGGGPGGAFACPYILQPVAVPGAEGGGGGAGGCGGQPAPGGQQGGASFAIVAASGSVLTLNHSRVVAGRSGDGGRGGGGGAGGLGGRHASGESLEGQHPDKGGDGGDGGVGGGGGGGAGGNGGPSAAVALVGGAKVDGTGTYYIGSSGNFGGGGAGGTSPVCPTGPGGPSGVLGSLAETLTYP